MLVQDLDTKSFELITYLNLPTYTDLDEVLSEGPDAVLICSPSSYHLSQAMEVIRRGMHVFIEKPLSHNLEGTAELAELADKKGVTVLAACNLRFFPSLMLVKTILDEGKVGKPLAARVHGGFYLPSWRPSTDYRKGYGARADLGGGVLLDFAHDLDYLRWLLGHPVEVFCWLSKLSDLEINTEDLVSMQFRFLNGAVAQVQFDYIQPTYRRGLELICEHGTITWDYTSQVVQVYVGENNQYRVYTENINTELNSMFIREMEHFVKCIEGSENPMVDARGGIAVVEMAEAAKRSSLLGDVVRLPLEI